MLKLRELTAEKRARLKILFRDVIRFHYEIRQLSVQNSYFTFERHDLNVIFNDRSHFFRFST